MARKYSLLMNGFVSKLKKLSTIQIIALSFFAVIFIGAVCLTLPIASADGESVDFIDALFTATSSVCVTGLVVFPTVEQWSLFGKVVIISLIQIGGLGFMSLVTLAFIFLGKKITLKERLLIKDSFNLSNTSGTVRLLLYIIKGTFIVEGIGALILFVRFLSEPNVSVGQALWYGVFHSISAFCNAGFDILATDSLCGYVDDVVINVVIMSLIVIGGLGFTVWADFTKHIKEIKSKHMTFKQSFRTMSVSSKLAIFTTAGLILFGASFVFINEYNNPDTIGNLSLKGKVLGSFFQAVTLRTAGFASINQIDLNYGTKFISVLLMFIGGSPGGTAGGIKTVTFMVIIMSVISVLKAKEDILIFNKKISFELLQKALAIVMLNASLVVISTTILTVSEKNSPFNYEFIDLVYETVSASATVGISTGITPYLSLVGKITIILCMFIGRIGSITFLLALNNKKKDTNAIHYPEEKVMIG